MKHALVVGGTGMLSNAVIWLINQGYNVSVIARNPERMKKLINRSQLPERITPLLIDYTNALDLRNALQNTIDQNGCINMVVAWIHSVGKNALDVISQEVSKDNGEWSLFQILGSSSDLQEIRSNVTFPENCKYRQVQLGFVIEDDYSRWLTNEEISQGVIEAIKHDKPLQVVGVLEPSDKRP